MVLSRNQDSGENYFYIFMPFFQACVCYLALSFEPLRHLCVGSVRDGFHFAVGEERGEK